MDKIRVAFFGTPSLAASVLRACLDAPDFDVRYAVTQPDKPVGRHAELTPSPVRVLAEGAGIPVLMPERLRDDAGFLARIASEPVDYFVVVAYGKILPKAVLDVPGRLAVNVHGSVLPKYRGASPVQSALLAGESATGITVMAMSEGMDEGDMLRVFPVGIGPEETAGTLFAKLEEISGNALVETVRAHFRGEIVPVPQDHAVATSCGKIGKEDGRLDFSLPARELFRRYQGYTPWPGVWCLLAGKRFKVLACRLSGGHALAPGRAAFRDGSAFVGTAEGELELLRVQLEGKAALSGADFFRTRPETALE